MASSFESFNRGVGRRDPWSGLSGSRPEDREKQIAILMRIVEELTNRPVGSVYQAAECLLDFLTRYRRLQVRLNETLAYDLSDPTLLNAIESCGQLADQHMALLRSIKNLHATRRPPRALSRFSEQPDMTE